MSEMVDVTCPSCGESIHCDTSERPFICAICEELIQVYFTDSDVGGVAVGRYKARIFEVSK